MNTIILILVTLFSASLTFTLHSRFNINTVLSSALPTLIVSALLFLNPNLLPMYLQTHLALVYIGGSFIGMISGKHVSTYMGLALASVIFAVLYINTSQFFNGYGGALGTSACISLLVIMAIPYFKSKRKLTVGLLQLRKFVFKGLK